MTRLWAAALFSGALVVGPGDAHGEPARISIDLGIADVCPAPEPCPECAVCPECPAPIECPDPIECPPVTICPEIPVNQAPVANAGPDQTVTLPAGETQVQVRLDGSKSNDPDGKYFGYLWEGTPKPWTSRLPYVMLGEGSHVFTLVIEDAEGALSEPDTVTITVVPETPLEPPFTGPVPVPESDDLSYLVDTGLSYPLTTTGAPANAPDSMDGAYDAYLIAEIDKLSRHADFMNAHPDRLFIRWISPHAYQSYGYKDPYLNGRGIPFATTGPATDGVGQVFAGHWRYYAGSKTTTDLPADGLYVDVQALKTVAVGDYVVIYDAPWGSFKNAEHAEVLGIVGSTLTLRRGHRSTAVAHPAGSVIAEHHKGQGTNPQLWGWHHGMNCPRDANGKQLSEVMAEWMVANVNRDGDGAPTGAEFDGVIFDADFGSMRQSGSLGFSSANTATADDGYDLTTGENLWGAGYDRFYTLLRQGFGPDFLIVGGAKSTGGWGILSGNQFESFPGGGAAGDGILATSNNEIDSYPSSIVAHSAGYGPGSRYSEVPSKHCTSVAPKGYETEEPRCLDPAITLPPWRLRFASVTIFGMYFGDQWKNRDTYGQLGPEPWYDEYSVDVTTGKADTLAQVKAGQGHLNWLGRPVGPALRVSPIGDGDLLYSESFDTDPGRTDKNLVSEVSGGTLKIGRYIAPTADWTGATVRLATRPTLPQGPVMVSFRARSEGPTWLRVTINSVGRQQLVTKEWRRFVTMIDMGAAGSKTLGFDAGRLTQYPVEVDDLRIYAGDPNLFYRRFEHGVLVANFTAVPQVVKLGETVRRIRGMQDPAINDGSLIADGVVTVPPGDAEILMRAVP